MCDIDSEVCTVAATATITFADGDSSSSGENSARGVDSLSNKENFEKIATSAGVEGSAVSGTVMLRARYICV